MNHAPLPPSPFPLHPNLRLGAAALLALVCACQTSDDPFDDELDDPRSEELSLREQDAEQFEQERELVLVTDDDETAKQALVQQQARRAPAPGPGLLSPELARRLADASHDDLIEVDVFLAGSTVPIDEPEASASGAVDRDGVLVDLELDGRPATDQDFEDHHANLIAVLQGAELARHAESRARWERVAKRHDLHDELEHAMHHGSSSATLLVPARTILQLQSDREHLPIHQITPHFDAEHGDQITSALASVEISTVAYPNAWNGEGVGVWMNDGNGRPITGTACVDTNDLTAQDYGAEPLETHATQTLCMLQASANEAQVHYAVPTQACNLRNDVNAFANPQVFVSSQSNNFGDTDASYSTCSRDWDNFIYDTRIAHFASAGNTNSNVQGAAKAYNVFGIGAYDDAPNPDIMANFSSWGDPMTGADKPEFVAPGVSLDIAPYVGISGTSFSTPIAAGFAADFMDRWMFPRLQPALLKAYFLVNSVDIDGSGFFGALDGAGRLDFGNLSYGKWWWWSGNNGSWFNQDTDGDGRLERVETYSLTAGQTYYVATSWLVDGNYVHGNGEPNMDIDLRVIAPNGTMWTSWSVENSYEMVTFTAPVTGVYTFQLERFWNSGQGNVSMGLVIRGR